MSTRPQHTLAGIRAFIITVEPINAPARTRTFYGKAQSIVSEAVEWARSVARKVGQSPMAMSVTVREA